MGRLPRAGFCVVGMLATLAACGSSVRGTTTTGALRDKAITVGSFDFAESDVLAEIYSQALEGGGYRVKRAFDLGPREFVAPALSRGLVELVPEYAGTALAFASLGSRRSTSDIATTQSRLAQALHGHRVTALTPAPAQDTNTFVVTRATAKRDGLRTISDLAKVDDELALGGPPECPSREECLRGLERVYGLKFKEFVRLDAGGPVTREALHAGYVDVALLFTTDPAIERDGLVELVDDRGLQPAQNVVPLIRDEVLDRFGPKVATLIDSVSARLTTSALTELNAQVAGGRPNVAVASAWLRREGLT